MKIYQGKYSWDGKKHDELEPIAWFPGSYDLKIIAMPDGGKGRVRYLKPYLCIFARTGEGLSISANPEKFAKRICAEFALELEKVLWVEDLLSGPEGFEVVGFRKTGKIGDTPFYRIERRRATAGELEMIAREIKTLEGVPSLE